MKKRNLIVISAYLILLSSPAMAQEDTVMSPFEQQQIDPIMPTHSNPSPINYGDEDQQ